jgi:hypothetical protein
MSCTESPASSCADMRLPDAFLLSELTEEEVFIALTEIETAKATCIDQIPHKIPKLLKVKLAPELTPLFNRCIPNSVFP